MFENDLPADLGYEICNEESTDLLTITCTFKPVSGNGQQHAHPLLPSFATRVAV